jgi:hypothetical protein
MLKLPDTFKYRKRSRLSPVTTIVDIADYKVGYIFSVWPIKIIKIKVSKIMEREDHIMVMSIFGREFVVR